jgi:hypothetical protein
MKAGDFRLVPAPMIILSITLWLVSGALNPLEFSRDMLFSISAYRFGIRIMSYALFNTAAGKFRSGIICNPDFMV